MTRDNKIDIIFFNKQDKEPELGPCDKYFSFFVGRVLKATLLLALFSTTYGCSFFTSYTVRIGNIGKYGVTIQDMPLEFNSKNDKLETGTTASDSGSNLYKAFIGNRYSLPDEITITWQLVELSNCNHEMPFRESGYFRKYGCERTPVDNKVFTRTFDLRAIKNGEVFQRKGKTSHRGWPSTNTAALLIQFDDEDVTIKARAGSTKLWQ